MDEYAKLALTSIERYCLEAMIHVGEGNLDQAAQVLKDGIDLYLGSFDLLFNLGFVYRMGPGPPFYGLGYLTLDPKRGAYCSNSCLAATKPKAP